MLKEPLVSVVMPAYKHKYIDQALDSLFAQTYSNIEVIICDDSADDKIQTLIAEKYQTSRFNINYSKNGKRLWGFGSVERGVGLATGEFIKILHDDDILVPECISELVAALEANPSAALATSKRQKINELNQPLEDDLFTASPFATDVLIKGAEVVSFLADQTINFIGEPSCTLCRRDNVLAFSDKYCSLNNKHIAWVGDLAFYVKLLRQGDLIYLVKPLTQFRVSKEQFSQRGRDQPGIGEKGHADFRQAIRDLGWYRQDGDNNKVQVARLTADYSLLPFKSIDLFQQLIQTQKNQTLVPTSVSEWLNARSLTKRQECHFAQQQQKHASVKLCVFILDGQNDQAAIQRTQTSLAQHKTVFTDTQTVQIDTRQLRWIEQLNQSVVESFGDWVLVLPAGVEFIASGLLLAQIELSERPAVRAVFFDELFRLVDGSLGAALRPDFNLDYLISFPAGMSKHWMFNRQSIIEVGGFNTELPEAIELDMILRLINQAGLSGLAHISEPLLITQAPVLANVDDERIAIEAHLRERGYEHAQVHAPNPGRYQVRYNHLQQPIVSILLEAGGDLAKLQRCVNGLLSNTSYQNFEILLFSQVTTPHSVCQWLTALAELQEVKLRIITPQSQTLSEQYNEVAEHAIGEYLLFLSANTAVVASEWLDELLNHGQRSEVGIVGAKLLSAEGNIAHAGYVLGLNGPLGSPFVGDPIDAAGYMQRLQVDQNLSAVSLDCLLVLRELFIQLQGFTDNDLAQPYLSADLCLRACEAGFLTVWTPHAQLMLDCESDTAPTSSQQDVMYEKWLPKLARDPAYNPNFSLVMPSGFKLADSQISWRPLDNFRPAPIVLVHPADLFGCGHYRVIQPFIAMQDEGLIDGAISTGLMHVTDLERYSPDTIVLQRQVSNERIDAMQRMQRFSQAFKVYELDDYLPNLPIKSMHRSHMPKDILRSIRKGLNFVDRFVVSTDALAEAFNGLHSEIVVVENRLPVAWWRDLTSLRRQSKKPRIGWAGGMGHSGDLELIADVVRDLADQVEWVFFGMCPDTLLPYVHEFHPGVEINEYPRKLASLNLDLGLAPLEMNLFNECKSNLRLLEFGVCGIPVVCTDIRPYQNNLPVTRVRNRYKEWMDAIVMHLADLDETARMGDALQKKIKQEWMLEGDCLKHWRSAWRDS